MPNWVADGADVGHYMGPTWAALNGPTTFCPRAPYQTHLGSPYGQPIWDRHRTVTVACARCLYGTDIVTGFSGAVGTGCSNECTYHIQIAAMLDLTPSLLLLMSHLICNENH